MQKINQTLQRLQKCKLDMTVTLSSSWYFGELELLDVQQSFFIAWFSNKGVYMFAQWFQNKKRWDVSSLFKFWSFFLVFFTSTESEKGNGFSKSPQNIFFYSDCWLSTRRISHNDEILLLSLCTVYTRLFIETKLIIRNSVFFRHVFFSSRLRPTFFFTYSMAEIYSWKK